MLDELMVKIRADKKKRSRPLRSNCLLSRLHRESSHGRSLDDPSDLAETFYSTVSSLIKEAWTKRRPLRLVSVRLSNVEQAGGQLELFTEKADKRRALAAVVDLLNQGKGKGAVQRGHQLTPESDGPERKR